MAKFIVLYHEPKDKDRFDKHYNEVHIPLVEKMPHVKSTSLNKIVDTQNNDLKYYQIVEIEYESLEDLNESLSSDAGRKVSEDAPNLAPFLHRPPVIFITA
ncbi:EthD family reductase [Peribacillus deserti]|uniref:EthD family reductase n=1 Tax=Peribacillus deserti TaxID=673318 RepID=UPI0015E14D89|nr:EthD family reductase [Peribacillus deserti]